MVKISQCMIVKDCGSKMGLAMETSFPHVDEVVIVDTGSSDNTKEVISSAFSALSKRGAQLTILDWDDKERHPEFGWIHDFSIPRNMSFDAVTGDVAFWLDADDEIIDPELFFEAIHNDFSEDARFPADVGYVDYDYQHDEDGNCIQRLYRERVVRVDNVNPFFQWQYPVHEAMQFLRRGTETNWRKKSSRDFFIRHNAGLLGTDSSARNMWIMQKYKDSGGKMIGRHWRALGDGYRGQEDFENAVESYSAGVALDCPVDDKYPMLIRRGDCYKKMNRYEDAMNSYAQAERLVPGFSAAYLATSEILLEQGRFEPAFVWCEKAANCQADSRSNSFNPMGTKTILTYLRAKSLEGLKLFDDALVEYRTLKKWVRNSEDLDKKIAALDETTKIGKLYGAMMNIVENADSEEQKTALMLNAPKRLSGFPDIARAKLPPLRGDKTIAIFCGGSVKPWSHLSVHEGIGGSEQAVIFMAYELTKLGWKVDIFGWPPLTQAGIHDDIGWYPYYAFDKEREYEVLISWRSVTAISDLDSKARQKFVWLHDTPREPEFRGKEIEEVDGIFVVSKYHRNLLPEIGKNLAIVTGNGLPEEAIKDGNNNPDCFVYASAPDRGLLDVLQFWPTILEKNPDAHLNLFYGFTPWYVNSMQNNPSLFELKQECDKLLDQPGVAMHGMVGLEVLVATFSRSGWWLYPTYWPEVSCINAMHAQTLGAIPITTSRCVETALSETCPWDQGPDIGPNKSKEEVIAAWRQSVLDAMDRDQTDFRREMKEWARSQFKWSRVAEQWSALFSGESKYHLQWEKPLIPVLKEVAVSST